MANLTERTSFTKDVQGRYLCNDVSIGVDEANDLIFGELQNALRRQLFDNLGCLILLYEVQAWQIA
jgi:hypothetical protein